MGNRARRASVCAEVHILRSAVFLSAISGSVVFAAGQSTTATPVTADAIMARVAANQDKSDAERSRYVYVQHAKMISRKGNKLMCEELTDYRVTPSGSDSHFQLIKVDGRIWHKGQYLNYDRLEPDNQDPQSTKGAAPKSTDGKAASDQPASKSKEPDHDSVDLDDTGLDRDLVENMRKNLLYNKSKDGIEARLFPLTSKAQADYTFSLVAREHLNGRDVYHVVFRPKAKNDFSWKGAAYIAQSSYQPVRVTRGRARSIPFAVRTFLGTNLPGLGFTVVYAPQADGIWFPATFSTEFKIRVLYFFHREILLNAQNRDFEKTHAESKILDGLTPVEKPQP